MINKEIKFVFFGSSEFSTHVLNTLEERGFSPIFIVNDARKDLPMEKLQELSADLFVVASFGKILPKELIYMPPFKTLNVHPSLLPRLRGPAPIQNTILLDEKPGVTIMRMDEQMDHGPLLAKTEVPVTGSPRYAELEKILGEAGGALLADLIPQWVKAEIEEEEQTHTDATYTKLIKKEDGLINLEDDAELNMRKLRAYSVWPEIFTILKRHDGKEVRVVIKDAEIKDGKFTPTLVLPAGKKEMSWDAFLRGNPLS